MSTKENIETLRETLICLHKFARTIGNKNVDFVKKWILINYAHIRLKEILKLGFTFLKLPDKIIQNYARKKCDELDFFVDSNACVLASLNVVQSPGWVYVFSLISRRMYKVFIVPSENISNNNIFISETMFFNLNKHLGVDLKNQPFYYLCKYFLLLF